MRICEVLREPHKVHTSINNTSHVGRHLARVTTLATRAVHQFKQWRVRAISSLVDRVVNACAASKFCVIKHTKRKTKRKIE